MNYHNIPDRTGWSLKEIDKKIRFPPLDVRLQEYLDGKWVTIEGRTERDVKPHLDEYLKRGYKVRFRNNNHYGLGLIEIHLIKK